MRFALFIVLVVVFSLLLLGCPPAVCVAPDPGDGGVTPLSNPCAGKPDKTACCLGAHVGSCYSNECVVK